MRPALRRERPPYLSQSGTWPGGNPRFYVKRKGMKAVPLPDRPMFHPDWMVAYGLAVGETRPLVRHGTILKAVVDFKASSVWKGLAPNTRAQRRPMLDDVQERYGAARVVDLQDVHIRRDLDRFEGHARNNRLKMWRAFGKWAVDEYNLPRNPAASVQKSKVAASDGHEPWQGEDIEAFRQRWPVGSAERLAFELIYWTGARVSDAIRLGPGNVDRQGWLVFRQAKTGGEVSIPYTRDLPTVAVDMAGDLALLHACVDAMADKHMTFITTQRGASKSANSISQWFSGKAKLAGLIGRTAHGLRKSRTIALIEAGTTTHQVGAWTGHESLSEIERYGRKFSRRQSLSRTKEERESSNFSENVPTTGRK